jgi:hypothetical protein
MRTLLTMLILFVSAAAVTGCTYEKKYYGERHEYRHGYSHGDRGGYYGGYYDHHHRGRDCR